MNRVAAFAFAAAALASTAGVARAAAPAQSVSVVASTSKAGAHPVTLTFTLRYTMRCGDPGQGPVTVQLPAAMSGPGKLDRSSVRVDGGVPSSVTRHGKEIVVKLTPRQWLTCKLYAIGTLRVVLRNAAGIGNPSRPGIYTFRVGVGPVMKAAPRLRVA